MLIASPITTKYFPQLNQRHHPTCAPYHFNSKHIQVSHTKRRNITTHNHLDTHTPINNVSENSGATRITTLPDVMAVKLPIRQRPREVKWKDLNMATTAGLAGMHLLCVLAPFTFNWKALQVAIGLDLLTRLLGINLSFHRHLSHKSFKIPKWLEYTFAYCGTQALQGNPIDWVRTHRYHHQYTDTERDPHTPIKGFWYSYALWMMDSNNLKNMVGDRNNVKDLEKQSFYRFLRRTYIAHPIALTLVLYALGGLPFIVWGIGVRTVVGYHITWLANSFGHGWGDRTWDTGDLSLNNRWMGILANGDGWHHNHHAFMYSARHGLEWWQVDVTWYLIRFLEIIGLASDVKLPTPADIQRKTLPMSDPSS